MNGRSVTPTVRIVLLNRQYEVWRWCCRRCTEELKSEGWHVVASKDPPKENPILACDGFSCMAVRGQVAA